LILLKILDVNYLRPPLYPPPYRGCHWNVVDLLGAVSRANRHRGLTSFGAKQ